MIDTINQVVYFTLPDRTLLKANYARGMDAKNIRWAKWSFDIEVSTIALIETNTLVIGSEQASS